MVICPFLYSRPFFLTLYIRLKLKCAYVIPGSEYEDPDDPTVIAENELLGAANSIGESHKSH